MVSFIKEKTAKHIVEEITSFDTFSSFNHSFCVIRASSLAVRAVGNLETSIYSRFHQLLYHDPTPAKFVVHMNKMFMFTISNFTKDINTPKMSHRFVGL